jgi:hypothetical protein
MKPAYPDFRVVARAASRPVLIVFSLLLLLALAPRAVFGQG